MTSRRSSGPHRYSNALLGCKKLSPGCAYCYACKDVIRMAGNPNPKVSRANRGLALRQTNGILNWTGLVRMVPERLAIPFEWPKAKRVFVDSLTICFTATCPRSSSAGCSPSWRRPVAHLPDSDQTRRASRGVVWLSRLARQRLDGRLGREPDVCVPRRLPAADRGRAQVPLARTSARTGRAGSHRDRLGDHRRRVRATRPAVRPALGDCGP